MRLILFRKKKDKCHNSVRREKLHDIVSDLQLPAGALPNCTHFEMNGNREVMIEGSRGILQYDENIIRLNMGKMIASFCGRSLSIKCLTQDSLIIEGFIKSIEFIT